MNSRKDSDIQLAQNELEYWKAKELSTLRPSSAWKMTERSQKTAYGRGLDGLRSWWDNDDRPIDA